MALIKESDHLHIPFKDLVVATENFTTLIGKGGYGNVYKGQLSLSGKLTTVAVKRLDPSISGQGFKEFLTEVHLLSRYKHPNLVSLLGFCHQRNEKILVYEHAEHGSLDKFLSMNTNVTNLLTCKQKVKICIDAACGLDYLHNHVAENHRVIHRDIKSANILLDHNWKAMISDLGLSKIGRANEYDTFVVTNACGTHGYCDPVYRDTGVLTKESDVYSLGVVLFEVLCGRLCIMNVNDERRFLAPLARRYYEKGEILDIIDPVMKEHLPSGSLNMISEIAYQCLHNDREERPSVGLVVKKLKEALEVLEMNVVRETGIFWLNDDIKSLVRRLMHQTEMFVTIVGEGGSGKTTLARAVYNNRKMKDHFEFRSWISVTGEYTAERIKSSILKSMDTVKGKRYLIVVDGVGDYDILQDLKESFPDEKNGSKVIFTSRKTSETVAFYPHIMNRLDEDKSWKMFVNKAGKEKEADRITAWLKHRILSLCNGSPQNIVLMAGLLSNSEIERWSMVIGDCQHPDNVVKICYDDLTTHSKLFVLHLALFPKDYEISVRRLLRLWLAKGFAERRNKDGLPEYLVQKCFEKLVGRNMIQITKLRSDNSPRLCRLVSFFHDYLLQKVLGKTTSSDVAVLFNLRYLGTRGIVLNSSAKLINYLELQDLPAIPPNNLSTLKGFAGKLCYLDMYSLPNSIWMLKRLQYLHLNDIRLTLSPDNFFDLKTLYTKHTNISSLPNFFRFFKQFQYLNPNNIRHIIAPNSLSALETPDLKPAIINSLPNSTWILKRLHDYLNLNNNCLTILSKSLSGDLDSIWRANIHSLSTDEKLYYCLLNDTDNLLRSTRLNNLSYFKLQGSLWMFKQLRHLNLSNIRVTMPPNSSLTVEIAKGLFLVDKITVNELEGVLMLINLKELGIEFQLNTRIQDALLDLIKKQYQTLLSQPTIRK